ncbi:MAG: PAS domain S-box protein, partial [Caldimicrobium sp.]
KNFEEAPIALAITSREGEIIRANKRARKLFEIEEEPKKTLKTSDFWVDPKDTEKFLQKLLEEGEVFSFEAKVKTAKGNPFYVLISAKVEEKKEKVLIHSAFTDITQYLKTKEETVRLFEIIKELLPVGVAMVDEEGLCIFSNRRLEEITGYTKEELRGSNLHMLLIAEEAAKERAIKAFQELKKRESKLAKKRVEFLAKRKNGSLFLAEIYFDEVYIEGKRYFIGAIQDVTERKRLEEQVFQREKELLIEKISAGLAHDLNNLLLISKGYLELLEEKAKTLDDRAIQYVKKVKEVYEKMSHLVLELFILSRGDIKKEEFIELSSFLEEWVVLLLRGTKIQVNFKKLEKNLYVPIQQSHLLSLISNIVINAKEAMNNLGELTVNLYREGDFAVIEISDTGKGIPEELVDKIFEPGFSTKPYGTGLGLFVVKKILETYKGEIFCRSKLNEGTTFIIKLPLARVRVEEKIDETTFATTKTTRQKILILDDERDIRELLQEVLTEKGYEVETFEDGDSAFESFMRALREGKPYQALLLDLTVPKGKGGVYLLKKLKEEKVDLSNVKVLLMTGYTEKHLKEEAEDVEFDGVLYKPFSIQKLIETLEK